MVGMVVDELPVYPPTGYHSFSTFKEGVGQDAGLQDMTDMGQGKHVACLWVAASHASLSGRQPSLSF